MKFCQTFSPQEKRNDACSHYNYSGIYFGSQYVKAKEVKFKALVFIFKLQSL